MMSQRREETRDFLVSRGAWLIRKLEPIIARGSRIPDQPFFDDVSRFPWVAPIEENWLDIQSELLRILERPERIPAFQEISSNQSRLSTDDRWKTYFFYAFGFRAEENCRECPRTAQIVESVPDLQTAFFSILAPGKHIPPHRGAFKGLLRYHLGLVIPEDAEQCRIRVGSQYRNWAAGKSLIFDDTYDHEVWNDTSDTRVVLFLDVVRPLRFPVSLLNSSIIGLIRNSPFVKDGIANYESWQEKLDQTG